MPPPSPWQLDVDDLLANPGTQRRVSVVARLEQIDVVGTRSRPDRDLVVAATLQAQAEGISAEGTVAVEWLGSCRRCLEDVEGTDSLPFKEMFLVDHVEGETYPIVDGLVDLESLARELIALALPLTPLCGSDCPGPYPERFPVIIDDPSTEAEPHDERWAALDILREDN